MFSMLSIHVYHTKHISLYNKYDFLPLHMIIIPYIFYGNVCIIIRNFNLQFNRIKGFIRYASDAKHPC